MVDLGTTDLIPLMLLEYHGHFINFTFCIFHTILITWHLIMMKVNIPRLSIIYGTFLSEGNKPERSTMYFFAIFFKLINI